MEDTTCDRLATSSVCDTWVEPTWEVIALDCEITAYAPDGDFPLL